MKFISKIISKIPTANSDWVRISLSLFLTGISFLIVDLIFLKETNDTKIMVISSFCMAIALYCFPYGDKDKLIISITKFTFYLIYLVITVIATIFWLSDISQNNISTLSSIIVAIMLIILINITLKPLFQAIGSVSTRIKDVAEQDRDGHVSTIFKGIFSNISIVTAFLISILTIINTLVDILKNIGAI